MTREDKRAYNYARDRLANDDYPVYSDEYELELAYKAGIEDAKNHPNWISVEDELPKDSGGFYLSVDKNGEIWYRQYTKLYGWRSVVGNMFISGWDVTHWMPLPAPPEKVGEQ